MFSTVVLPAPFGPIRLVMPPARVSKARSLTARTPPNCIERPSAASSWALSRCGSTTFASDDCSDGAGVLPKRTSIRRHRPAAPSGATHSTTSSNSPKNSSRYSSRLDSASGSRPTISAPTSGPPMAPAPPIITTSTNRIDWPKPKVCGVTKPDSGANSPPAAPAQSADTANATVLMRSGSSPIDSAAVSLSRTARIAAPQPPCESNAKAASATPAVTTASIAAARSPFAKPPSTGPAMPMMPFCPPVRSRASTIACSTMKAKAMVIIARYGPRARNAGNASSAPMAPAISAPTGQASQKLQPALPVRIATA